MYTFKVYLLVVLIRCSETSSSSDFGIFKEEYLNPKSVDHRKLSGRWYEHMDTLNNTLRDDTFVDYVVLCDGRIRSVQILNRWISSLEECRTTAVAFQPEKSDSPDGFIMRMSTNETLGKVTIKYLDLHPTEGFVVIHRHTHHLPDSYLISTRRRDPRNLDEVIKQALLALHLDIGNFFVKSKDFGCERREENGIKL
ncbi:uncharacterized protein LOC125676960 [Ostrea edulis]|uniref:uncharacterized protein LOC125676960 n=1 Tax=Ostrea edulis TaxID=37623 RepID=UPI0024AEF10A|nr:uncharacterized protein LOC125676960 [Ostrea edulis]